jgi:protein ImuA
MSPDLAGLRARIRAIEGGGTALGREVAKLGPALDEELPWGGLPAAALHEIGGPAASAAAAAFARRCLERPGALLWCRSDRLAALHGEIYGPGLRPYGIDPARLLIVRAPNERQALWAFEEALRSPAVACVVAEIERLDLLTSRRLQLAAETGGGTGLVLRHGPPDPSPNAALTRWRATPAPAVGDGLRLRLELWRIKGGAAGSREERWDEQTLAFALSPGLADRADGARREAAR